MYCTENTVQILRGGDKAYPLEKLFLDARAGMIEDGLNNTLSTTVGTVIPREE